MLMMIISTLCHDDTHVDTNTAKTNGKTHVVDQILVELSMNSSRQPGTRERHENLLPEEPDP